MAESLTISQLPPPFRSMQYELLRQKGIDIIQNLAGKIQTDFNAHDPAVTILEVLSYAITDLGYRTNYNIRDILTPNPNLPEDIRNFFAAKEIMPNYPVTLNDYRKLMIDVEVPITGVTDCTSVGVKNAWIERATDNEIPFYADKFKKTLTYTNPTPPVDRLQPECLFNILLEFNECKGLGDLNENVMRGFTRLYLLSSPGFNNPYRPLVSPGPYVVNQIPSDMNGLQVEVGIEFPRWDTPGVDWDSLDSIRSFSKNLSLDILHLPEKYTINGYGLRLVEKSVYVTMVEFLTNPVDSTGVEYELDDYLFNATTGLIVAYQKKVKAIFEVLAAVKARLMANRNLGEDFFRFNAIKVEEILLCADIEIRADATVEQVQADIYHQVERFLSPTVYFYSLQEMYDKGKTTDEIFEGPRLNNGFILDEELTKAERRNVIHVSDLISIIMDVPGVIAVKSIEIANLPLDNDDHILSHEVKWCLELAVDKNYVPHLSIDRSNLTFYKNELPYRADQFRMQEILDALEAADRPQKLGFQSDDIPLEAGEYKDIENYYSIQEEFPLVYGIGTPGLPATASIDRQAQAKQLKAFLLFFDQLLADYLSQLFHVKDLFSMNDGKDTNGDPIINKTYFTQSLINIVPDALPLYINPTGHAQRLQADAEDAATYENRRNRFLDHLMARFAESFADYALLIYKIDGPKAPAELIEDKLAFLNNYPLISSARGTGFNYKSPCNLWSVDNISGIERRAEYLTGVDRPAVNELTFGAQFKINVAGADPDQYYLAVLDNFLANFIYSVNGPNYGYTSLDLAKEAMEVLIINGAQPEKYFIIDPVTLEPIDPASPPATFRFGIFCDGNLLGYSANDYATLPATHAKILLALSIIGNEFMENPEANRYNLECFMEKYVQKSEVIPFPDTSDPLCPPKYSWDYTLTDGNPITPKTFLTGVVSGLEHLGQQPDFDNLMMDTLRAASDFKNYRFSFNGSMEEVFTVVDRCEDVLGTSFEVDFTQPIQDDLLAIKMLTPTGVFQVVNSTGNDGSYTASAVTIDTTNAQLLKITTNETPASAISDGFFKYTIDSTTTPTLVPTVTDANTADNFFTVNKPLNRIVFPGEKITVESGPDAGDYTVLHIVLSGTDSLIYVKETIPDTAPGTPYMSYVKKLPIVAVDVANKIFYVKPGADAVAAQELADWVKAKFFSHEGMHVIEHVLLRPKYNGTAFVPITPAIGLQTTTPLGSVTFLRNETSYTVNASLKQITITGFSYNDELPVFSKIKIIGSNNEGTYTVRTATLSAGNTIVTVYETIPDNSNTGTVQFSATKTITSVAAFDSFKVTDAAAHDYSNLSDTIFITGSGSTANNDLGINDGVYHISLPVSGGPDYVFTLVEKRIPVRDAFLPIDVDNKCEICRYEDPYSFIVTVILPAWQGRFINQDFRNFFERTIRLECPAHILLNICWIDCAQMGQFEPRYKKWLLENAKEQKDQMALSFAQNDLIASLITLRTVYPEGTLHDCDTNDATSNSIILNQTALGTL